VSVTRYLVHDSSCRSIRNLPLAAEFFHYASAQFGGGGEGERGLFMEEEAFKFKGGVWRGFIESGTLNTAGNASSITYVS